MSQPLLSRPEHNRIVGGLIVGVVPERRLAHSSFADRRAHLFISGPGSLERTSTGPIQVRVTVPKGYTHELVANDDGFGHGYDLHVEQRGHAPQDQGPPLRVEVLVPAAETVPIELEVIPEAGAERVPHRRGHSNRPTRVQTGPLG